MNRKELKHIKILVVSGLIIALHLIGSTCHAQEEVFSLPQCIQRAVESNIQIKQQVLSTNYSKNQAQQAKYNRLPSADGSVQWSMDLGNSLSSNNTYQNENSQTITVGASATANIFNGFRVENSIKKAAIDYEVELKNLDKAKQDISLQVVSYYLEILLNKELVESAKEQLNVIKQQIEYNKKQVEAGNMAKGKLYETEAQEANEELNLTNYENRLQLSRVNLQQLLELEVSNSFDVSTPDIDTDLLTAKLIESDSVFIYAIENRPEIAAKILELQSAQLSSKIAKADYYPSVYAGLSINSGFYSTSKDMSSQKALIPVYGKSTMNDTIGYLPTSIPLYGSTTSLSNQLDNNMRTSVYAGVRIPLFNRFQTRTNCQNSRIQIENQQYLLDLEKNNLRKEIEQVQTNALAAMKRYYSSQKALESAKEAFRYVEEKFRLGIVTPLEYNQSKNQVINAQSTLIQAKYEYVFRTKILDFYMGKPLSL